MGFFSAVLTVAGWIFSFTLISAVALIGASHSPNTDALAYVGITIGINFICYAVLMHNYLKLKYLCDKFIE